MPVATFPIGPLSTNSYVLHNTNTAAVIDVGGDPTDIVQYLTKNKLRLDAICITHLHFDHLYGVAQLAKITNAPVYVPKGDAILAGTEACDGGIWGLPKVPPFSSKEIEPGENSFAGMPCTVLSTPGHTPGSVSFYFPNEHVVFTGDALFYRSVGRTDFPLSDTETLFTSIRTQLFPLPDDTRVFPGHGPETTIHDEKNDNPYCGTFTF